MMDSNEIRPLTEVAVQEATEVAAVTEVIATSIQSKEEVIALFFQKINDGKHIFVPGGGCFATKIMHPSLAGDELVTKAKMVSVINAQWKNVTMGFEKILDEIFALNGIIIAVKDFLMQFPKQLTIARTKSNGIDSVITHSNYLLEKKKKKKNLPSKSGQKVP